MPAQEDMNFCRNVVARSMEEMPLDPSDEDYDENQIYADLLCAQPLEALKRASELDPWLAAHMADLLAALELIEGGLGPEG